MKNKILLFLLMISFNSFSQEINLGISLGSGLSNQTLRTESNFSTSAGMVWNTIGGLPYRVDSYLGYNAGLILEIFFDLSSEQVDEKIIKRKISLKTGINYSSQGVIVEDALLAALESGKIAAAALDVFVGEPSPRKDLLSHQKISLTPHIGAATSEAQDRIGTELAEKLISRFGN